MNRLEKREPNYLNDLNDMYIDETVIEETRFIQNIPIYDDPFFENYHAYEPTYSKIYLSFQEHFGPKGFIFLWRIRW